jgi:hypothetical protein
MNEAGEEGKSQVMIVVDGIGLLRIIQIPPSSPTVSSLNSKLSSSRALAHVPFRLQTSSWKLEIIGEWQFNTVEPRGLTLSTSA